MNASPSRVVSVHVGPVAPLGPNAVPSGFVKRTVAGRVGATSDGLAGDAQADRRCHGGNDKAVYGYGDAAYAVWRDMFPRHAPRLIPGSMGENLTLAGVDETTVCIGDRVGIGTALLQVTEPRQPCFKLALHFDDPAMPRAMTRSGLSGWYYRVLEPGMVAAGDPHVLIDRPNDSWPVRRFFEVIIARADGRELLTEMLAIEGLSEGWKLKALQRLARLRGGA